MPSSSDDYLQRLEEIVAYLDGELSPEESARVEQRLAADENYRQQLQSIERAWLALDQLPQEYVDDRFSRTTMEMAVKAAATEVHERTIALPVVQRRRRLSSVLAACAAAALGFLVFRLAWQGPDRALLADLPVIDNVDVYTQIDSPEFLRSLQAELGDDLHELGGQPHVAPERVDRLRVVSHEDGRDEWLGQLNDEERTSLRSKFNRFRQLPAEEQQRLRRLHAEIAAAPDAEELQAAMLAYNEWLSGLPPARQFELRTMQPISERVRAVERWADDMRDDALLTLTDDELRRFIRRIRDPLAELQFDAARDVVKSDDMRKGNRGNGAMLNLPNAMARQVAAGMARPGEFQEAVLEALPERTHEKFKSLEPPQKIDRIMTWLRQSESLQGEVSQETLERFFAEELDAETRAELLSLPPDEMEKALRRMYRFQPGRGTGKAWAWGRGERGQGPGGREWRDGRGPKFGPGGPGGPGREPGGPGGPPGRKWDDGPGPGDMRFNGPPRFDGPGGPGDEPHPRWDGRGPRPGFEGDRRRPEDFGPPPPPPVEEPPAEQQPTPPADDPEPFGK
ncbi:MAG: hypothetical protein JNL18_15380 [Planctomycetaceae bacterium]|nr:hypothetical protein [Planctomycetaceae bacterium]